jgi:hypothetical protein
MPSSSASTYLSVMTTWYVVRSSSVEASATERARVTAYDGGATAASRKRWMLSKWVNKNKSRCSAGNSCRICLSAWSLSSMMMAVRVWSGSCAAMGGVA